MGFFMNGVADVIFSIVPELREIVFSPLASLSLTQYLLVVVIGLQVMVLASIYLPREDTVAMLHKLVTAEDSGGAGLPLPDPEEGGQQRVPDDGITTTKRVVLALMFATGGFLIGVAFSEFMAIMLATMGFIFGLDLAAD